MSIIAKYLLVCLTLVLALPLGLSSCAGKLSAAEIASRAVDAYSKVETYAVNDSLTATTEVVGGDRPGKTVTSQNTTGLVDMTGRQIEMAVIQNGSPLSGMQSSTELYLVDEWLYVKNDIHGIEDDDHEIWVKLDLTDEQLNRNDSLWADKDRLTQQIEFLRTAREVTLRGSEKVNGIDSYVLEIKPDWPVLTEWLALQPPWRGPRFFDFPRLSRALLVRQWIAKDTYLPIRVDIEAIYEMVSFGSSKSTVELKGQVNFHDYNKPVRIEPPHDALNAVKGPIS